MENYELILLAERTVKALNPPPSALVSTQRVVWNMLLLAEEIGRERAFNSMREEVACEPVASVHG